MSCCETSKQTYDWWSSMELDKDWEENLAMRQPPFSAVTFYKGELPRQFLRKRWIEVVNTNPWLAGRLCKEPNSGRVILKVPPHPPHADRLCTELGSVGFSPGMDYEELVRLCLANTQVKPGCTALEMELQLSQLALARAGKGYFVLILSICPVIADGHNFYSIYNMLDPSAQLVPLDHSFVHYDAREEIMRAIGQPKYEYSLDTRRSVFTKMVGLIRNERSPQPLLRYVNEDFVSAQKRSVSSSSSSAAVSWVSTNDVLTSWFVNVTHADYVLLRINWRHRMGSLTDAIAGNYEGILHYWSDEANSPQKIRQSISSPPHYGGARQDVPSALDELWQRQCYIANWGNYYRDVNLPDSELVNHTPIIAGSLVPGGFTLVIFKARSKQTAVYIHGHSKQVMSELAGEVALGAPFVPGAVGGI